MYHADEGPVGPSFLSVWCISLALLVHAHCVVCGHLNTPRAHAQQGVK